MTDTILKYYRTQLEGRKGAQEAYERGIKELKANYAGKLLESKLEALKTAHNDTIKRLKDESIEKINMSFDEMKKALNNAASKPIPASIRESLTAFEGLKLSDAEKSMILDMTKNSYLARKRAIELMDISDDDLPPSFDDVMENLNSLEKVINGSFAKPVDSYDARLIAQGDWVNSLYDQVTAFCDAYGDAN